MRYNIYCDEASTDGARYMLIGGLWVPQDIEEQVRTSLNEVRERFNLGREMKWTKVSRTMLPAYKEFIDVFFVHTTLSFRCIVVDTHRLDYKMFHKGDTELGFYKFYYLLISRNLRSDHLYWLYTDERRNRNPYRLDTLKIVVNRWMQKNRGATPLRVIEARQSHIEDFIQLSDILLGAIAYAWNDRSESQAKLELISHILHHQNWATLRIATSSRTTKMNIWKWKPVGSEE